MPARRKEQLCKKDLFIRLALVYPGSLDEASSFVAIREIFSSDNEVSVYIM